MSTLGTIAPLRLLLIGLTEAEGKAALRAAGHIESCRFARCTATPTVVCAVKEDPKAPWCEGISITAACGTHRIELEQRFRR